MATASSLIDRARSYIRIHSGEEPLQAYEATDGLTEMRSMLDQWTKANTISGFVAGGLADPVLVTIRNKRDATPETIDIDADLAIATNLALLMSVRYGVEPSGLLIQLAADSKDSISALDLNNADNRSQFDIALLTTNSRHRYG